MAEGCLQPGRCKLGYTHGTHSGLDGMSRFGPGTYVFDRERERHCWGRGNNRVSPTANGIALAADAVFKSWAQRAYCVYCLNFSLPLNNDQCIHGKVFHIESFTAKRCQKPHPHNSTPPPQKTASPCLFVLAFKRGGVINRPPCGFAAHQSTRWYAALEITHNTPSVRG